MPFYRQEKRFERIGVHISRQVMAGWVMAVARRLSPLIERIANRIREGPRIHMDETRMQVLGEPEKANTAQSYMWLALGGEPAEPLCLYHYSESRGAEYPRTFLADYEGPLQTDAYGVYARIAAEHPRIVLVGCWAHARRKFHEAAQAGKKTAAAREEVARINKLYRIETELRGDEMSDEEFVSKRRERVEAELAKFRQWLENKREQVVPSTLLGKAVAYTLDQWETLTRYLDYAALTPDNNIAEQQIRPFVVGRKNWLISGSPRGADASCALYSLIQSAKLNGLNPFAYLHYVFTHAATLSHDSDWEALLPTTLDADRINAGFPATVR
jgi:transposase